MLTLPDGRALAWAEFGPPDGTPVVYCHGGNDCRLGAAWFWPTLADAGLRLIVPDRPGFGASSPAPGRVLLDWGADLGALLDHLQIDRLPLFGLSGGGPHVLAAGAAAPERFTRAAVVSGPSPWTRGFLRGTWLPIRLAYLIARWAPRFVVKGLQKAMNNAERNMRYSDRMPAPDARVLREVAGLKERIIASVTEAHRHGYDGAVTEWRLYTRPWGFDLADVSLPVSLWYGTGDGMAPVAMGERLAAQLPNASLNVIEGEAHLSLIVHHARRIVDDLRG